MTERIPVMTTTEIPAAFLVERQGRHFILFAGLLHMAHGDGLSRVTTTIVQLPTDENGHTSIFRAEVETKRGTFTGTGDANPTNVAPNMRQVAIRLAETRAIARALRFAVDAPFAALDELGGDELSPDVGRSPAPKSTARSGDGKTV